MARMAAVASPNVMQRPEQIPVEPLAESINRNLVGLAQLLTSLGIEMNAAVNIVRQGDRTFYRFSSTEGTRLIPVQIDSGHCNKKLITAEDAGYIAEQTRLKREEYQSLEQIRQRVAEATGASIEAVIPHSFLDGRIESAVAGVGRRTAGMLVFRYPSISNGGKELSITVVKDGAEYILKNEDAGIIIADEIAKRKKYVELVALGSELKTTRPTLVNWCEELGIKIVVCGKIAYVPLEGAGILREQRKPVELPEGARRIYPLLKRLHIPKHMFMRGLVHEGENHWFDYRAIVDDKVVTRRIRVHRTHENLYYITPKEREQLIKDKMAEREWISDHEFAGCIGLTFGTVQNHKKDGMVHLSLKGGKQIDTPYVLFEGETKIKLGNWVVGIWSGQSELMAKLGMDRATLDVYKDELYGVYRVPFMGQIVELRYVRLRAGVWVNMQPLMEARTGD